MAYEPEFIRTSNFTDKGQILVSPNADEVEALTVPDGHVVVGDATARTGFATQEAGGGGVGEQGYLAALSGDGITITDGFPEQNDHPYSSLTAPSHAYNIDVPSWLALDEGTPSTIHIDPGVYLLTGYLNASVDTAGTDQGLQFSIQRVGSNSTSITAKDFDNALQFPFVDNAATGQRSAILSVPAVGNGGQAFKIAVSAYGADFGGAGSVNVNLSICKIA